MSDREHYHSHASKLFTTESTPIKQSFILMKNQDSLSSTMNFEKPIYRLDLAPIADAK